MDEEKTIPEIASELAALVAENRQRIESEFLEKESMANTSKVVRKIYADGRTEDVSEKMTLEQMQHFVGGYIEMVAVTTPRRALIVNEEGALKNLPYNRQATELVRPGTMMLNGIQGDALLIKSMQRPMIGHRFLEREAQN